MRTTPATPASCNRDCSFHSRAPYHAGVGVVENFIRLIVECGLFPFQFAKYTNSPSGAQSSRIIYDFDNIYESSFCANIYCVECLSGIAIFIGCVFANAKALNSFNFRRSINH